MVGLVLIVVVVMIIMLVLLVFMLKNPAQPENRREIENFLDSLTLYTTECEEDTGFLDIKEAAVACYENSICANGELACDVLNSTISKIVDSSFNARTDIKGYIFNVDYRYESSALGLVSKKHGVCGEEYSGSEEVYPAGLGTVALKMRVCY